MVRVYFFVEGQTELTFVRDVLIPHFSPRGVGLKILLIANARRRGITSRGGGTKYVPMRKDIQHLLSEDSSADAFFTTMIDLYGLHRDFPSLEAAERLRQTPYRRVEMLEQAFASDINDHRFIPYIQLHEYETYLFAGPEAFAEYYDHRESEVTALQRIVDSYESPEMINDGTDSAPSKRLIQLFPDYAKMKPVLGPLIAERIGLSKIRQKCPHFDQWITRLERI